MTIRSSPVSMEIWPGPLRRIPHDYAGDRGKARGRAGRQQDNLAAAKPRYEEASWIRRETGNKRGFAFSLHKLGL